MIHFIKKVILFCFPFLRRKKVSCQQVVDIEYPRDFSQEEIENISKVKNYTMTSNERLVALSRAIDYVEANKIDGDFVECGVWRGGSMMLSALKLISLRKTDRELFLFDTFEGMSEPTEFDVHSTNKKDAKTLLDEAEQVPGFNIWCISALEEVEQNLKSTGYPEDKMHFIKGKVEDTLPCNDIKKISILRLDTDWYESTKHELETLFDKLERGGVLIIDDYGHWSGAQKAVDEFLEKNNIKMFLNRIDYTGRLGIKI